MKDKLKQYIDDLFRGAPACRECEELREELISNTYERYDDLIDDGRSESDAYEAAIWGLGDVSMLIENIKAEQPTKFAATDAEAKAEPELELTPEQQIEADKYFLRRGIMSTVSVMLYMMCWVPLILLSSIDNLGDIGDAIGLAALMVMVCIATAIQIMKGVIAPSFLRDKNDLLENENDRREHDREKRRTPLHRIVNGILWGAVIASYVTVSLISGAYAVTWIIFIIGGALDNVLDGIFELIERDGNNG